MNLKILSKGRDRGRQAFTLIELLTVIAILAILVTLTVAIVGYANDKAAEEKTRTTLTLLVSGIKKYYDTYGEYPVPVDNTGQGVGGSVALYQAMSDDGSDELVGGEGEASDGEAGENMVLEIFSHKIIGESDNQFLLIDGYGKAFRYMVYDPNNPEATHNETYDLWSYGTDKEGDNESKWIKNW